ncbi:glycosyltransferase [uncultured Alistipes sp.]|uniref:glycosyltransferase n=1 Tax=uncultured Alistipes sp. TaxID=538949 RepID=UPI0034548F22
MTHFILTRFNLKLWTKDKSNIPVQTEVWLNKRFDLFETYCLPSIINQTNQNFKWICLFDIDTPCAYKSKITEYIIRCPNFHPYYLNKKETINYLEYFKDCIKKLRGGDNDAIITTYLDNDDCLRCDYIESVQRLAYTASHKTIISFEYGLQYFINLGVVNHIPYPNNHFLTLIETADNLDFKTVWSINHYFLSSYRKDYNILTIRDKKEMWIEVIHNNNVDNDAKMTLKFYPILSPQCLHAYGLNINLNPIRSIIVFIFCFYPRFFRQIIRRIMNKIKYEAH